MEQSHRELLRKHRMDLCSEMNAELIAKDLLEAKIFTLADKNSITFERDPLKRNEKLLDILPKRGPMAYQTFLDILNKLNLSHLSAMFDETASTTPATVTGTK